jgi:hypothetical protein
MSKAALGWVRSLGGPAIGRQAGGIRPEELHHVVLQLCPTFVINNSKPQSYQRGGRLSL